MSEGTVLKWIAAAGGGIASFLWGGWSIAIQTLFVFVAIDYITGFLASATEGKLSSKAGMKGIAKKAYIFVIVALCHMADQTIGDGTHLFRDGAITFYLINESLSIIENTGRLGVPVPDQLRQAIEILKGKTQNKKEEK